MNNNTITMTEYGRGMTLVAEKYIEFKKLAEEQIRKEPGLTDADYNDVVIGLVVTKLLVAEGKLEEKYFESAIS